MKRGKDLNDFEEEGLMSEHRWSVLSQTAQLAQVWRGTETSVTSAFGSVGKMSANRVVETTSRGQNSATHSISKNLYRFIACHFLNSMNSQSSHEMISTLYLFLINILSNILKNQFTKFTKRFVRKHDVNQCNHLQIHQI